MDVRSTKKPRVDVPTVRVRIEGDPSQGQEWFFSESFRIGRGEDCEVRISGAMVSRKHLEVAYEGDTWWVRDLESSNGTFHRGERVSRMAIDDNVEIQLGRDGPVVSIRCVSTPEGQKESNQRSVSNPETRSSIESNETERISLVEDTFRQSIELDKNTSEKFQDPGKSSPETDDAGSEQFVPIRSEENDLSLSRYIRHYFDEQSTTAGIHTKMIRRAYDEVRKKQKKKYYLAIGVVAVLFLIATGAAIFQYMENQRLEQAANELFYDMREIDLENARILRALAESGQDMSNVFDRAGRQQLMTSKREEYDAYVEELGLRRKLRPDERLIHRMAYIFNESELAIPAAFIREVREGIQYWQQSGTEFEDIIHQAEERGYIEQIVRKLQSYGLPPHFFYLALVESRLDPRAVGTPTNYGYAKGMWQFIPGTAEVYGLELGPLWQIRQFDQLDERHDFAKSTDAAARYLLDIYSTLAQASGLLVMASYNWGERRIAGRLDELEDRLPDEVARDALSSIPEDTRARTYWNFYGEYQDIMPAETKDYVIRIFSAAVIGENPRLFGFSMDNPLEKYLDTYDDLVL